MKTQLLWLPEKTFQLNVIKQLFVMLTESEGQEFGQGTTGAAYPCSVMASAGWLKGSGLKSFEGLSFCVLGGWCWFTSGNEPLHVTSAGLVWASSQPEGWVPRVSILGERENQVDAIPLWMLWSWKSLSIMAAVEPATKASPGSLSTNGKILENVWDWKYCFGTF